MYIYIYTHTYTVIYTYYKEICSKIMKMMPSFNIEQLTFLVPRAAGRLEAALCEDAPRHDNRLLWKPWAIEVVMVSMVAMAFGELLWLTYGCYG